jgi:hypothetical protein
MEVPVLPKFAQQHPQAPCASGLPLNSMLRVATSVEQIVTAVITAVTEEKIMTITKIVITAMNFNGH